MTKTIEDYSHKLSSIDTGRWSILVSNKGRYVLCRCSCGNVKDVRVDSLISGESKSCGCLLKDVASERMSTKGGISKHPLYQAWYDMNRRCSVASRKDYIHYG